MENEIKNNLLNIHNSIQQTAIQFKRNPADIKLIAVSKFQDSAKIQAALDCEQHEFGENYIQEWQEKNKHFLNYTQKINWHIIGNIQKNKAKYINNNIFCIQSIDSVDLAQEIEKKAKLDKKINVLIQLKIDETDVNKSGISQEKSYALRDYILQSNKLTLQGFMGIGPLESEMAKRKELYFSFTDHALKLWKEIYSTPTNNPILSLGMSTDFTTAIECGSNMLRIGSAIFGVRPS